MADHRTVSTLYVYKRQVPRERALKDEEDVRAIMRFTKIDVEAVKKEARKNNTLPILESITA